jgi:hypothetical protein
MTDIQIWKTAMILLKTNKSLARPFMIQLIKLQIITRSEAVEMLNKHIR